MFKKLWKGVGRHKYTFLGLSIIALFSLFNFVWFVKTGESFDIKGKKDLLFALWYFDALFTSLFLFCLKGT